ncbi:hypothetical protein [Bdellovibrio bacteriovorus]|uniref:hypothetical protein n=1 Tax=Bdellovibrio bacteriovorus TaxID=959 RepID=UPI0035A66A8C
MNKKQLAIAVGAVAVGGVMLIMTSLSVKNETPNEKPSVEQHSPEAPASPASEGPTAVVQNPAPVVPEARKGESAPVWKDYAYKKELSAFHRMHRKVFLDEAEKKERQDLLKNHRVISSLSDLLQAPALTVDEVILQNVALDLLLESLQDSPHGEALGVLKDVVSNGYIEDKANNLEARKSLGEVKAEVLYQWSALQPQKKSEIERLLPGPVSKKIWENVRYQQENNLAESSLELRK